MAERLLTPKYAKYLPNPYIKRLQNWPELSCKLTRRQSGTNNFDVPSEIQLPKKMKN
jgi:hypothetical protein